jgi:two-component system OmpR family response regulator
MRLLVVEDETNVRRQIVTTAKRAGYAVDEAADGEEGWFLGDTEPYDAIILDLGLPKIDGLEVLRRWRSAGIKTPILILTARDSWRDKVTGLREGADDYLGKPFELEEMMARIEALVRRAAGHASPIIECGPLRLDTGAARVTADGDLLDLTPLEYRALAYLMHHKGKAISKTELTEHIYGQDFDRDSNVIEVLINRLRKKVGAGLIATRRGQGYQLTENGNAP